MRWMALLVVCACGSKQPGPPAGSGSAAPVPIVASVNGSSTCASVEARVAALYREEAQRKEPKRVDDAVADNTAMVMRDCATAPAKIAACLATAATTGEVEKKCMTPLDPEGTEGDKL